MPLLGLAPEPMRLSGGSYMKLQGKKPQAFQTEAQLAAGRTYDA